MNGPAPSRADRVRSAVLPALLLALFSYVFYVNAWIGDDAYITFRTIDNFVNGYGLRWNVAERVQAFTHPLWLMLVALFYRVTREPLWTSYAISYALCVTALFGVWARHRPRSQAIVLVLLLLSSKAFMDYTSSGLENPLSYFLLVLFYQPFLREKFDGPIARARILYYFLIGSLAFLNRQDSILLLAGPLAWLGIRALREHRLRALPVLALATAPAWGWELFSIVYYGFPFPNTYYAKMNMPGVPPSLLWRHGGFYLLNSVQFDPVTVCAIAAALLLAATSRRLRPALIAISILLHLLYVVSIGGDFMTGRFLTLPFLVAALLAVERPISPRVAMGLVALLALYNVWAPRAPIKTSRAYEGWNADSHHGITDERSHFQADTGPLFCVGGNSVEDNMLVKIGRSLRILKEKVYFFGTPGFMGYCAGPGLHFVDKYCLGDPLMARLPPSADSLANFQIGHFARSVPGGYVDSCEQGTNVIIDPGLHEYYDRLCVITRGPLFTRERWTCILDFNLGSARRYEREYQGD
jgi:arabinofuranosyltransferase